MIKLSEHFSYKKILKFVTPSIAMMVFASIYGVIDGLFVSNFAGKEAFASINLIIPFLMVLGAIGFMVGSGGNAVISQTIGEGKIDKAKEYFTMLLAVTIISGAAITVLGEIFLKPIAIFLGAKGENAHLLDNCLIYGRIILICMPAFMLQNVFQVFFTTAEKPMLGFLFTALAGITNIALDALFVGLLGYGITGAAVATVASVLVGGIAPLFYFCKKNNSLLQFVKFKFDFKVIWKTATNGCSELMSNISSSIVSILFNMQLLKYAGVNGVSAYGVIMYVQFIFIAIFLGYSIGTAPIIGFNYGSKNKTELKNVLKKSLILLGVFSIILTSAALALAVPIAKLFVGYDAELTTLTENAFFIVSFVFLICGFNIFSSSFFTALGNGIISALISFLRTLVFQTACVMLLPIFFGISGIWFSLIVAEFCAMIITIIFLLAKRKKYGY